MKYTRDQIHGEFSLRFLIPPIIYTGVVASFFFPQVLDFLRVNSLLLTAIGSVAPLLSMGFLISTIGEIPTWYLRRKIERNNPLLFWDQLAKKDSFVISQIQRRWSFIPVNVNVMISVYLGLLTVAILYRVLGVLLFPLVLKIWYPIWIIFFFVPLFNIYTTNKSMRSIASSISGA